MSRDRTTPRRVLLGSILWLVTVSLGFAWMARYENSPGSRGATPPMEWPCPEALPRDPDGPTLVMVAHPKCPCTRASLEELNRLLARCPKRPRTYVLFYEPEASDATWSDSGLWQRAAAIPGVRVQRDPEGRLARRWGSETSGHVYLHDGQGRLVFQGGITASRGHVGDNHGSGAIIALLQGNGIARSETPVFGCQLLGP